MKNGRSIKITAAVLGVCLAAFLSFTFIKEISFVFAKAAVVSAARLLPSAAIETARDITANTKRDKTEQSESETDPVTGPVSAGEDDFYAVPDDIRKLIENFPSYCTENRSCAEAVTVALVGNIFYCRLFNIEVNAGIKCLRYKVADIEGCNFNDFLFCEVIESYNFVNSVKEFRSENLF